MKNLNIKLTIEKIINKAEKSNMSVDTIRLKELSDEPNGGEEYLLDCCIFCDVVPVYD
jgi:hypothetical protein